MRVKCLAQEHNTMPRAWQGLEPGPLALESSALTMRPPGVSIHASLYGNQLVIFVIICNTYCWSYVLRNLIFIHF